MPRKCSREVRRQVFELARSGTRVKQVAATLGVPVVTTYNWLKHDRVDRGEELGKTSRAAARACRPRRRISQVEAERAVSGKINEAFLKEGINPKGSFG